MRWPCVVCQERGLERPAVRGCFGLGPVLYFCAPCAEAHARECPLVASGRNKVRDLREGE